MLNLLFIFHLGHAHLYCDFTALPLLAVHRIHCLLRLQLIGELNEAETTVLIVCVV